MVVLIRNRQKAPDGIRSVRPPTRMAARRNVARCGMNEVEPQDAELATPPAMLARQGKEILLVDPDPKGLLAVQVALRLVAAVTICTDFRDARSRLLNQPPDLLITNLRLKAYNGLHLVHLTAGTRSRCIVYSTHDDLMLAREAQAAGAFFEHPLRLPLVLHSYVNATLPHHDRRDLTMLDRRMAFRGGRRCSDPYSASVATFCE